MVIIKSPREIALMKEAGKVVGLVFKKLEQEIHPGMTTLDIDAIVEKTMLENDCTPSEKGYYGYPASACVSVNETLLHGIPSNKIVIHEGDIVSVDIVANYHGYHADACRTFKVGTITERASRLVDTTKASFFEAVKLIKPGVYLGDICHRIQEFIESSGYNVVREFTGHGIGSHMHEDPNIPNYGKPGTGPVLKEGMTIAVEPMLNLGTPKIYILDDDWTIVTRDGLPSAHYEHTVVVTKDGYRILTGDDNFE